MTKEQQKFQSSLQAAVNADDYDLVVGVLVKEIGWLLKNDRLGLIRTVKEAGGNVADKTSDADLSKMVSYALINRHKSFIDKLLALIYADKAKYLNDNDLASLGAKGITAVGDAITNAQFGKATKSAQKDLDALTKRAKVYEMASQIVAQKESAKLDVNIASEEEEIKTENQKNYMQAGFILGATVILSLIIWGVYKASK